MKFRSLSGFLAMALCLSVSSAFAEGSAGVRIVSAEQTALGAAFELAFDALPDGSESVRTLYALYGVRDYGIYTNGWEHVERLATVAPADTSASVTLSSDFNSATPYLRFVVLSGVTSLSYASDGLVAQWDGLDNAGRGTHSMDSTTWVDLTGHGWDAVYPGGCKYACWQDSSFFFVRSDKCTFSVIRQNLQATLGPSWTIEAFVKPTEWDFYDYAGIAGAHNTSGQGICFFQYEGGSFRAGTYQQTILDYAPGNSLVANEQRHLACTADGSACVARAYADGAVVAENQFASGRSTLDNPNFFLGNAYDASTKREFEGYIYAIRVYSRVLTPEELAINRAIDVARFTEGATGTFGASDVFSYRSLQTIEITGVNRSASGVDSFDLRISGDIGEAASIYVAYGVVDGGSVTDGWDCVEFVRGITASDRELTVSVPAGFGDELVCIRFFVFSDAIGFSTLDYARQGLVAQWDGADNAGIGQHDSNATVWKDLSGNGWDAIGTAAWTTDAHVFTRSSKNASATVRTGLQPSLGSSWTVEAYVKPDAANFQNYSGVCGAHAGYGQGIAFCQYESGNFQLGTYQTRLTEDAYYPAALCPAGESSYLALTVDSALSVVAGYVNGHAPRVSTLASDLPDLSIDKFYIGNAFDGSKERMFSGEISSVRVYSRALTAAEIAAHRAIDRVRFGGGGALGFISSAAYRLSKEVNLTIRSSSAYGGAADPGFGSYFDIVTRLPLECTSVQFSTNNAVLYECRGSELAKAGSETSVTNAGLSYVFNAEDSGSWALTWLWETAGYTVDASHNTDGVVGTVEVDAPDYHGFHSAGSSVEVRAVAATDQLAFDHWEGDVPAGMDHVATIILPMDGNKAVHAVFRPAYWLYDAEAGTISDGFGCFKASAEGRDLTLGRFQSHADGMLDLSLPIRDANGVEYVLKTIGESCCEGCQTLTALKLPETVEVFGDHAFSACRKLTSVTPFLPRSVRRLGLWTFTYAPITNALELGVERMVDLAESDEVSLGGSQFSQCENIPKVTLGPGVTNIPSYFIYNGSTLKTSLCEVRLGNPQTIGRFAFSGRRKLVSVTPFLPDSVRFIGEQAFSYATMTNMLTLGRAHKVELDPAGSQFSQCPNIPCAELGRGVREMPDYFLCGVVGDNHLVKFVSSAVTNIGFNALSRLPLTDAYFGRYHTMDPMAFDRGQESKLPDYQVRLHVPKSSLEWDAYIADPTKVTPWNEVGDEAQVAFASRFGAGAKPPLGLTLANDRLPASQWVFRWNPSTSGTMLLVR